MCSQYSFFSRKPPRKSTSEENLFSVASLKNVFYRTSFFFVYSLLACDLARLCAVYFLSAVRAVAARCKLPFALRPGLPHENAMRTKKIAKEMTKGKDEKPPSPLLRTP